MSLLVGCYGWGSCAIYNRETDAISSMNFGRVQLDLKGLNVALDQLVTAAPPERVKRIVFSHNGCTALDIATLADSLKARGYLSVQLMHWIPIKLQALIISRNVSFMEGKCVLVTCARTDDEVTSRWQLLNGHLMCVEELPIVTNSTNALSIAARQLIEKHNISQWLLVACPKVKRVLNNNFSDVKIINGPADFSLHEYANAALRIAKRLEGMVTGIPIRSCHFGEIYIYLDGQLAYESSSLFSLPFEWKTKIGSKAQIIRLEWQGLTKDWPIPQGRIIRGVIVIDASYLPSFHVEELQVGISLHHDSMFIATGSENPDNTQEPLVLGPFPTRLRLDKNPPEATNDSCGAAVVSDIFDNLDSSIIPRKKWIKSYESDHSTIYSTDRKKGVISTIQAASCLLKFAIRQANAEGEKGLALVLPNTFSENEQRTLRKAAESVHSEVVIIEEQKAVLLGHAMNCRLTEGDTILALELSMTGCLFSLAECKEGHLDIVNKKEEKSLNVENVRQGQRKWLKRNQDVAYPSVETAKPEAELEQRQNSTYSVEAVEENALNQLLESTRVVLHEQRTHPDSVKSVLLLGQCHLLPLLNNLLRWRFVNASITTPTGDQVRKLAAIGGSVCCQSFRSFTQSIDVN